MEVVFITGLSGAGKTTAMKSMEDLGYYCVDNLPPSLINKFIELCELNTKTHKLAIGVDIRGGIFLSDFMRNINEAKEKYNNIRVLFVEAKNEVLLNRFKELRRPHPLSENISILDAIENERVTMKTFRDISDIIIDSSNMKISELKEAIKDLILKDDLKPRMSIIVSSFGFKRGINIDADLVFDVRFLKNPAYDDELKKLTGDDKRVRDFVMNDEVSKEFFEKIKDLIKFLIPKYIDEGKSQLNIGFGCTGGKHRSVTFANLLHDELIKMNYRTYIRHRDIGKE